MKCWFLGGAAIVLWQRRSFLLKPPPEPFKARFPTKCWRDHRSARRTHRATNQPTALGSCGCQRVLSVASLPPGTYRLDVAQDRFAKTSLVNIPLQVAETERSISA